MASSRVRAWVQARELSAEELSWCSRLLGALNDLAIVNAHRRSGMRPSPQRDELLLIAAVLSRGASAPPGRWLAGAHFNSAKHRLVTVAEALRIVAYKKRAPSRWRALKRDDNRVKHEGHKLIGGQYSVSAVSAVLDRVDEVLAHIGA